MKKTKNKTKVYEDFPIWIVWLASVVSVLIYVFGAYILLQFGVWIMVLYLVYCFWVEIRISKKSCVDCYYYGKLCAFGRGKICSLIFKKGNPKNFCKKKISPVDILPDFLVFIFPLIGGIILLIKNFSWTILLLLIILFILSFCGNAFIRGNFACKYCKQRELGCPAERLFNKKRQK